MSKITKFFPVEIKKVDKKNLIVTHFISTETPDRIGDVVRVDGMVLRGKPSVLLGHNHTGEAIAKPLELKKGKNSKGAKGILAKTQYFPDEDGKRLFQKAVDGYMPNWSIGFESIEDAPIDGGGTEFKKWELLEYSQVAVPMNPEAKVEEGKENEKITFKWSEEKGLEKESNKDNDKEDPDGIKDEEELDFEEDKIIEKEIVIEPAAKEKEDKSIADRTRTNLAWSSIDTLYYGFLMELDECGGEEKTVKKIVKEFAELLLPFSLEFSQSISEARGQDPQLKWSTLYTIKNRLKKGETIIPKELEEYIKSLKPDNLNIEDLETKEGKVLSKKNWNMLKECYENLGKVLESAGQAGDEDKGIINNPKTPEKKDSCIRLIDDSTPAATEKPKIALSDEEIASIRQGIGEQVRQSIERINALFGKVT